jgi:hypothetical protein
MTLPRLAIAFAFAAASCCASAATAPAKPEAAVVDIDGTESVTPAIVNACVKNPKALFWQTLQGAWKRLEATVKNDIKNAEKAL